MSFDAYQPPSVGSQLDVEMGGHHPTRGLTTALTALLGLSAGRSALSIIAMGVQIELLGRIALGQFTQAEAATSDTLVQALAGVELALLFATAIVLFVWFNRSNRNARAFGNAEYMQFGPNAWGWFFCPLLNLWKPFQAFRELWNTSQEPAKYEPPPVYFGAWWGFWLGGGVLGNLAASMLNQTKVEALVTASGLSIAASVCSIVAAGCLILVVRGIARVQEERARGSRSPTA
jgi:hypothetical protein